MQRWRWGGRGVQVQADNKGVRVVSWWATGEELLGKRVLERVPVRCDSRGESRTREVRCNGRGTGGSTERLGCSESVLKHAHNASMLL